jgi:predicted ribosomally synthesized peptide with nif11-like leader
MSIQSAKAFMKRMKNDQEFAKKITDVKNAADRMTVAKEAGYDFSSQEIENLKQALTDDELEEVVGGSMPQYMPCIVGSTEATHYC